MNAVYLRIFAAAMQLALTSLAVLFARVDKATVEMVSLVRVVSRQFQHK